MSAAPTSTFTTQASTFPRYTRYKDSGVEWLGEVPAHWEVEPGSTTLALNKEKNTGNVENTVLSLSYGRLIIKPPEKLTGLVPESFEGYQIINPGDIIIRPTDLQNDTTSLRVGLSKYRGIITSAYLGLKHNDNASSEYLYYLMHSYDLMKVYYGMGTGLRQNLSWLDFKYLPLALPPKTEQDRIVAFLDTKTAEIDALIQKKERQIQLLDEQKAIRINQAVTRGLNPNVTLKPSGIEWLPEYPSAWNLVRFKFLDNSTGISIQIGPFGGMIKDLPSTHTGFKVYGQENTISSDLSRGNRWLEHYRFKALKEYHIKKDDILLTRKGSIGNAFRTPETFVPGIIDSDTIRVRVTSQSLQLDYFLLLMKESPFMNEQIFHTAKGAIIAGLNSQTIKNLIAPIPGRDEQRKILAYVAEVKSKHNATAARITTQIKNLKTLRSTLIAHAVTGKIKV